MSTTGGTGWGGFEAGVCISRTKKRDSGVARRFPRAFSHCFPFHDAPSWAPGSSRGAGPSRDEPRRGNNYVKEIDNRPKNNLKKKFCTKKMATTRFRGQKIKDFFFPFHRPYRGLGPRWTPMGGPGPGSCFRGEVFTLGNVLCHFGQKESSSEWKLWLTLIGQEKMVDNGETSLNWHLIVSHLSLDSHSSGHFISTLFSLDLALD